METLVLMFQTCADILNLPFTFAGLTFSLMDVLKVSLFLCLTGWAIGRIIHLNNGE